MMLLAGLQTLPPSATLTSWLLGQDRLLVADSMMNS
jgi:hypothetical protein